MTQYKYYLKKPKGEIVKDILFWLMLGGAVAIAATSPYFVHNALGAFHKQKKYRPQSVGNAFKRLLREGAISLQKHNHQVYISLTKEGRKKAGRFQLNDLEVKKPKKWDKKWRIVIFDVDNRERFKREVLRGFLKRLGFYKLQQSVWIHSFGCSDEIALLKDFFGFTSKEVRLIVAEQVENSEVLIKKFHLS